MRYPDVDGGASNETPASVTWVSEQGFTWDPSLYEGSAAYYARGRMPYPVEIVEVLADRLGLDGSGRLLDLGCGPGSLTLLLADLFAETVGVDADAAMVAEAERRSREAGVRNATWRPMRAEELPADLGRSAWSRWRSPSTGWTENASPAASAPCWTQTARGST